MHTRTSVQFNPEELGSPSRQSKTAELWLLARMSGQPTRKSCASCNISDGGETNFKATHRRTCISEWRFLQRLARQQCRSTQECCPWNSIGANITDTSLISDEAPTRIQAHTHSPPPGNAPASPHGSPCRSRDLRIGRGVHGTDASRLAAFVRERRAASLTPWTFPP